MKNLMVFLGLLLIGSLGFAQIESYNIESSKTYDDGTKTAYLSLEGDFTQQLRACFEEEIKHTEAIQMFRFYDSGNPGKCMITSSVDFTIEALESLIQKVNSAFEKSVKQSKVNISEFDILLFESYSNKSNFDEEVAKKDLLKYEFIKYVAFGMNSEFKIGVLKNTSEENVLNALHAVGLDVK